MGKKHGVNSIPNRRDKKMSEIIKATIWVFPFLVYEAITAYIVGYSSPLISTNEGLIIFLGCFSFLVIGTGIGVGYAKLIRGDFKE